LIKVLIDVASSFTSTVRTDQCFAAETSTKHYRFR